MSPSSAPGGAVGSGSEPGCIGASAGFGRPSWWGVWEKRGKGRRGLVVVLCFNACCWEVSVYDSRLSIHMWLV